MNSAASSVVSSVDPWIEAFHFSIGGHQLSARVRMAERKRLRPTGNARNSGRYFSSRPQKSQSVRPAHPDSALQGQAPCSSIRLNAVKAKYWNHQESYCCSAFDCIWPTAQSYLSVQLNLIILELEHADDARSTVQYRGLCKVAAGSVMVTWRADLV